MKRASLLCISICLILLVAPVLADYTISFQALTNSPADSVNNFIGNYPSAPTTTYNISIQRIPVAGTINTVEIYDYSGTAGTAEAYAYYLRKNNATNYLIKSLSVSANERIFTNTSMGVAVVAGDTIEIQRVHPVWATNPLTNIVGGYAVVTTTGTPGYTLFGQALSNSPADSVQNYLGSQLAVPSTTAGNAKVFVPETGLVNNSQVTDYSGTAGTAEAYLYSLNLNGTSVSPIQSIALAANLRLFGNSTLGISAARGNYLEWNRTHPAWVTNPLTNVVGSIAFINTTTTTHAHGYPIAIEALTSSPADSQTVYFGNRPIVPSTTPGTNKIYIRQNGTITQANIYTYSGTAGTNESWSINVVKNNTQTFLVQTNALATNERIWWNTTIDIPVVSGDYLEISGVQPVWSTNPLTTVYGGYLYEMYDGAPPVPSFTLSNTSGTSPTIVTATDTSITTITSRSWSATNTLNGSTIAFGAGASPATITLDNGHWNFAETVTNASETRTSGNTLVTVNPSGGYTGFVPQDIYMQGQYAITFLINDADGNLLSGATVTDSTGQSNTTGANGVTTLTEPFGTILVTAGASGYYGKTMSYVVDSDASHTLTLTALPAATVQNSNTIWTPHQVVFQFIDANSNPIIGGYSSAQAITSTIPGGLSGGLSLFETTYGVSASAASVMLSSNLTMNSTTDDSGSIVYLLVPTVEYNINITDSTGAVFTKTIYPLDSYYQIKTTTALTQSQADLANSNQNIYNGESIFIANFTEPNSSYGTMNNYIYDDTGHTGGANCWFTCADNSTTWWDNQTWAYGSGIRIINKTVPVVAFQQWKWGCITI